MDIFTQLKRDEGEILHVYPDSKGIPTAGVGHNLPAHGINLPLGTSISQEQSDEWLKEDVLKVNEQLAKNIPWCLSLDIPRFGVLQNMCFNMGWGDGVKGLSGFHHFLESVRTGDYSLASTQMLQSKWSGDVGARARRLARQMEGGIWI